MYLIQATVIVSIAIWLVGCSGSGTQSEGRYSIRHDRGPDEQVDLSQVKDAVPRQERRSRGGNKSPYTVWGKSYHVMASSDGYRQQGTASWYGKKFHGHQTSNGEIYDMYAMSAAHKSLPLPSYVRVTNLDNQRSVVVRVNDRGPFHGSRLIDLSYAAAYKLDMLKRGTARVEVEAITPQQYSPTAVARSSTAKPLAESKKTLSPASYIQVGAYSSWASAQSVKTRIEGLVEDVAVRIEKREGTKTLYRVQMGPVDSTAPLERIYTRLRSAGFADAHLVD